MAGDVRGAALAAALTAALCCPAVLRCQDEIRTFMLARGNDTLSAGGYRIASKTDGAWATAGEFTVPTLSLLLGYRPRVREAFGEDLPAASLMESIEDICSGIDTALDDDGRVWVGFGFYEGEGWEGYGGIGFCDPAAHTVGVLRHPALVDFSVQSLMVTDSVLYVQTIGRYELTTTVGNGLVLIDRRTGMARALVPPGETRTLWDKDDSASVAPIYMRPVGELLRDRRLVEHAVPQYPESERRRIAEIGLDAFMVRAAAEEHRSRERALERAGVSRDLLLLDASRRHYAVRGAETGVELSGSDLRAIAPACGLEGIADVTLGVTSAYPFSENFGIRPAELFPGLIAGDSRFSVVPEGLTIVRETSRMRVTIVVDTLESREAACDVDGETVRFQYFRKVGVTVEVRRLTE